MRKDIVKITLSLTIICIICAFFLSFVFNISKDKIALNAQKRIYDALKTITPGAKFAEKKISHNTIYEIKDKNNKTFAYGFICEGEGYQGKIKILAVFSPLKDKLLGIEIIDSVETPGLGAKIQDDFFKNQFRNLVVSPEIEYTKTGPRKENQIQAITGATISSKSVVFILNKRIKEIKKLLNLK